MTDNPYDPDDRVRVGGWVPSRNDSTTTQQLQLRAIPSPSSDAAARLVEPGSVALETVPVEPRRLGRWWFAVVPVAVVVLVVAVALQFGSGDGPTRRGVPDPPVGAALPVLSESARANEPSASASTSSSASAKASSSSSARQTASASASKSASTVPPAPPAPIAHRGAIVGIGGRCLAADRNGPELANCADRSSQRWSMPGDGTARVMGFCLDVYASGETNGTPVILYQCNRTDAQQWQVRGDGTWRNPQSNKCLSTVGGRSDPGTRLAVFDCAGGQHQKWTLT